MVSITPYFPAWIVYFIGLAYFAYAIFWTSQALPAPWPQFILAIICFKVVGIVGGLIGLAEKHYIQNKAVDEYNAKLDAYLAEAEKAAASEDAPLDPQ